ncbi:putative 1-phosphatidylinositol-3-phosphate 5-kinase fab1c [Quercus suber]|uniref:1-phosphatidylinositol-3-phosphate 5-kinase fab1c n=1 Tax=Quercus suber TaxID=58331 RepID=A0AAW0JF30_QUESU
MAQDETLAGEMNGSIRSEKADENEVSSEYFSATETHQSILVSFSSHCVLKGIVCERFRSLGIKFCGSFDKPLGRYLRDDFFSNHATANLVAPCGHSLQRDCLRYYGFGSMVAFFRYSPIDILSVHWPPSVLEFNGDVQHERTRKEAAKLVRKMKTLYAEMSDVLDSLEEKYKVCFDRLLWRLHSHWLAGDILELNRLRRSLLVGSHVWDQRLCSLDSPLKKSSISKAAQGDASYAQLKELKSELSHKDGMLGTGYEDSDSSKLHESPGNNLQSEQEQPNVPPFEPFVAVDSMLTTCHHHVRSEEEKHSDGEVSVNKTLSESLSPNESTLSERIDSAWTDTNQPAMKAQLHSSHADELQAGSVRLMSPMRVRAFDSALQVQERIRKGLPPSSLDLLTLRSSHASGDYRSMVRDPVSNVMRTYSQMLPWETQNLNSIVSSTPSFISSVSHMAEGARLLLTQIGHNDLVIAVYENEPTSIISYALSSKEYNDSMLHHQTMGTVFKTPKRPPHLTISFEDEFSTARGKVKFSVTCYFAKQFDSLRKKCCPSEVDFVPSLSRCRTWSAQGGKSNVYFAKSLDERFVIKQVTKTELDSFADFAPQYFKYLTESISSRSQTCLAKILGIYQVSVKHLKGGKETKMDLMVMENLFFKRDISRVYDLKGSTRARYNSDTTGTYKVLLDMNLLETLRTKPKFLGSKAERILERAVWNDTSFLESVDVMDYSLLVGVDDERKELVLGIIDFMRQYTWDKHLDTWVKASGILDGPKNASPSIISSKQYKKRFRKAMTTYFLTVPDQWS